MISRKQFVTIAVGAAVLGATFIFVPFVRAAVLAVSLAAVAGVVLLPSGWYSGVDASTQRVLRLFLLARLGMPIVFHTVANLADVLFTGGSDSLRYHFYALRVASELLDTGSAISHTRIPGSGAIELSLGYFYAFGAPIRIIGDYAFNAIAAIGMLVFWSATHHLAGPRRAWYTGLLLLAPTLLFWNAGIGKEAPMTLAIGCVVAGVALLHRRIQGWRGAICLALGVSIACLVRPHIGLLLVFGAVLGVALAATSLDQKTKGRRLIPILVGVSALPILLPFTEALIDPTGQASFADAAYRQAETITAVGGRSTFEASTPQSALDLPGAIVTVLFRPFPWEVRTAMQALASAEAFTMLVMLVVAVFSVVKHRARFPRSALVMMAAIYTVLFSAVFASIGNFGLLVRERMQVLPFVILIVFSLRAVAARPIHDMSPQTAPPFRVD